MTKQQKEHLGVYGVIISEKDEILLIKKARGPYKGLLDLPGGRPEFEETLEETLKREVFEETGLQVTSCKQLKTIVKIVEDEDAIIRHTAILYEAEGEGDLKTGSDGRDSEGAEWFLLNKLRMSRLSEVAISAVELHVKFIYHYTTRDALQEILKTKKLRLSSCDNYKDEDAEHKALDKVIRKNLENAAFRKGLLNYIPDSKSIDGNNHDAIVNYIANIRSKSYMICFSKNHDNLELWKKYAEDSLGVVLGMERVYFAAGKPYIDTTENQERSSRICWIEHMQYGDELFVQNVCANSKDNEIDLAFDIDGYKQIKYSSEKESRLVAYCPTDPPETNKLDIQVEGRYGEIIREFTYSNGYLYVQIATELYNQSDVDNSNAIKFILCKNEKTRNQVLRALFKHGYSYLGEELLDNMFYKIVFS